jgi:hypothetical protein
VAAFKYGGDLLNATKDVERPYYIRAILRYIPPLMDSIRENLERRKLAKENPCESGNGSGLSNAGTEERKLACGHYLGQGIRITDDEHRLLMEIVLTGSDGTSIQHHRLGHYLLKRLTIL